MDGTFPEKLNVTVNITPIGLGYTSAEKVSPVYAVKYFTDDELVIASIQIISNNIL